MLKKILLLSLPFILTGCSFFTSQHEVTSEKKLILPESRIAKDKKYDEILIEIEEILKAVQDIRGLKTGVPVSVGFKNIPELNSFLNDSVEEKYTDADFKKDYYLLEKLGLIKSGTDLKEMVVNLYSEQTAGFYDDSSRTFYLIEDHISGERLEFNFVISHELVHALQDLNFNLSKITEIKNDDVLLARMALIEGEAVIVAFKYLLGSFGMENMPALSAFLNNRSVYALSHKELGDTPGFMVEEMIFPYIEGGKFVNYIYEKNSSWEALNKVYRELPESTEQILHPEKYLSGEKPLPVFSYDFLNDKDWQLLEINTLGEFSMFNFFLEYLDEATARKASTGWGGDSYSLFLKNDKDSLLALKTMWDTPEDASEFYQAYLGTIKERYTGYGLKVITETENSFQAESLKGLISLSFNENQVNIAEGYTRDMQAKVNEYFNKQ